jgi:integrase
VAMRVTRRRTRSAANSGRRSTVVVAVSGPQSDANKFEGNTEDTPSLGIELLAVRDATMILIGYRHGLRASELCDLQWSQVELATGRLHVRRAKNGSPSVHPMQGDEIRALRRLQREQAPSSHVFMTERDGPMTPKAFHALFGRIGARAKMQFPIHPHMLRHGCGYALANAGHDTRALQAWLGHKNIQHTVRYTELAPDRFKNFWR